MPPSPSTRALNHRRQHNILLLKKVLEARDGASPFTLVLDSVEQSARGLVALCVERARASKTDVVFVSYETLKAPVGVDKVVKARRKGCICIPYKTTISNTTPPLSHHTGTLLILDTLHPLATSPTSLPPNLTSLLSLAPTLSLLAIYHTDIPLPSPSPSLSSYHPLPLPLLTYLATTILTTHNPSHLLARLRAREKCIPEPRFGIEEGRDGVVVGMESAAVGQQGGEFVLEMEYRRKSGRGVREWFSLQRGEAALGARPKGDFILLDDHPLFSTTDPATEAGVSHESGTAAHSAGLGYAMQRDVTFELGLTQKQRGQREGVEAPYFDAQRGEGGEGGRILYDLGVEDDFDEEEDEI
ncbi:Elongator complex protein 5 [Usnea florida]